MIRTPFIGILLFSGILGSASANDLVTKDFENEQALTRLWHNEQIYYLPSDHNAVLTWNGTFYHYPKKKCYRIRQEKMHLSPIRVKVKPCDKELLSRAKFPSNEISDFKIYKSRLIECLESKNHLCLRGLISKTLQISFGMDPLGDRRDFIFKTWKDSDYKEIIEILKKGGDRGQGEVRYAPRSESSKKPSFSKRAIFKKYGDGWLLVTYLGGD